MKSIFVVREAEESECRVAASPQSVKKLCDAGFSVWVEAGAGERAFISDQEFIKSGAAIENDSLRGVSQADLILSVQPPSVATIRSAKKGVSLITCFQRDEHQAIIECLVEKEGTLFSMNDIPRTTRAQSMDALSSQSNLAGYKAVILAAAESPKIFPMLMTAAGTLRPVKVVVLGAGVAGLQAVATAKRLGALVAVSDVRTVVREQVSSLGAEFIEVDSDEDMETSGGYAKEQSEAFLEKQRLATEKYLIAADVVITTALIHGRPAPKLISAELVSRMTPGAVIVDLAAERGGNCELTSPGNKVCHHGVTILGTLNVPASVPLHASEVYARNILNVVMDQKQESDVFLWNEDDDILEHTLLVRDGVALHDIAGTARRKAVVSEVENKIDDAIEEVVNGN